MPIFIQSSFPGGPSTAYWGTLKQAKADKADGATVQVRNSYADKPRKV